MHIDHTQTPCQISTVLTWHLCDQGACGGALISPCWWEDTDGLVVSGQTVDTGFDENQSELGVLVLAVSLEMLADSDSLLDQHVQVLWDLWGEAIRLEDSENLVTSDNLDLGNTVRISEDDTDLGRSSTLLCELADLIDDLLGGGLQPRRRGSRVWNCGG